MVAAIPEEVRRAIVSVYENGNASQGEVARLFGIGVASVVRILAKYRRNESLAPIRHPGAPRRTAIGDDLEVLKSIIEAHADYSQQELAWEYEAQTGMKVSRATVGRRLKELGFTLKKSPSKPPNGRAKPSSRSAGPMKAGKRR